MPKLEQYSAPASVAPLQGGRAATPGDVSANYETVGPALQKTSSTIMAHLESTEERQVLVDQTQIRAKYGKRLDEAAINGEDTAAIHQAMQDELDKSAEGLQTRAGATAAAYHSSRTNELFQSEANHIEVQKAAAKARLQGAQFLNDTGNILFQNPGYLPQALKDADAFVTTLEGVSAETKAEQAQSLKQHFNFSAAMRSASLDPAGTKAAVEGGAYDLKPDDRPKIIGHADQVLAAARADKHAAYEENRRAIHDADEGAQTSWLKLIDKGKGDAHAIANDSRLLPSSVRILTEWMTVRANALNKTEKASDPITRKNLFLRINSPDGTPNKLYNRDEIIAAAGKEAGAKGFLNITDTKELLGEVDKQTDENHRTIGSKLYSQMQIMEHAFIQDPKYIGQPGLVASILMQYQADVYDKVNKLRNTPGSNPNDVFNPSSKEYVGSPKFIQGSVIAAKGNRQNVLPDLPKATNAAEILAIPITNPPTMYVDENGVRFTKTQAGHDAALKQLKTAAPSVKPPAQLKIEAEHAKRLEPAADKFFKLMEDSATTDEQRQEMARRLQGNK